MHSGKTTTTQSSKLQHAPPPSPLACCCTGRQGGVSWAPSSPWVVETEKVEVHCAKIIEMDRCRTCCNNSPSVGGFPPQPITPQMLPLLHQSGWPKEFFFFFKSQEEAKIRKAALLWLCLSQPTITHSVERHITGLSHRSGSQSQWLLRGISHETIRKTTVRDANFIFIHLISFTQVIFILF